MSLIGTCGVIYLLGFSINNMTLLALTLSVGFVVDDAIVMLENITRHIENGMRPFEAALKGAREIGFTIISITFSLIAVFIPVLLMSGIVGRLFREFAVTVVVAILVSGFVSLTLTPMLCARMLKHRSPDEKQNVVLRIFERGFDAWLRGYEKALDFVLHYKFMMVVLTIATVIGTGVLYYLAPKSLFPEEDTGFLQAQMEGATDTSFDAMVARQLQVNAILAADPAVMYYNASVGSGGPNNTGNIANLFIALKPKGQREPIRAVINRLSGKIAAVAGITPTFRARQNLNIGQQGRGKYQFTMQSGDSEALYAAAPTMLQKIAAIPGIIQVRTDLAVRNPQMTIEIDREKAAIYGIGADQIRAQLFNAYGSRQISTIYAAANDYQVILEVPPQYRDDPSKLAKLYLKTAAGQTVPLDAVAKLVPTVGPLQINHQGQQPSVTISYDLQPGYAEDYAGNAIRAVRDAANLPASIVTGFAGTQQVFEDAKAGQGLLVLAAVFAAFIILGILYESFIHPITIISGLPSAGVGAILTLMLFGMDMSVIAMIGIVMLVGIVKKNAIMMVDFAVGRRRVGLSAEHAIREAALLRFRPIMMTTFAAIFGTLPIALGTGAGAELRQPLGVAVVGGLLVSQALTLFITPVVYVYLDKIDRLLKRRLEPQLEEVADEPERPRVVAAE